MKNKLIHGLYVSLFLSMHSTLISNPIKVLYHDRIEFFTGETTTTFFGLLKICYNLQKYILNIFSFTNNQHISKPILDIS